MSDTVSTTLHLPSLYTKLKKKALNCKSLY